MREWHGPWGGVPGKSLYLTKTLDPCMGNLCPNHCAGVLGMGVTGWGLILERSRVGVHVDLSEGRWAWVTDGCR